MRLVFGRFDADADALLRATLLTKLVGKARDLPAPADVRRAGARYPTREEGEWLINSTQPRFEMASDFVRFNTEYVSPSRSSRAGKSRPLFGGTRARRGHSLRSRLAH